MTKILRTALLAATVCGFGLAAAPAPAHAYFHHHHKHYKVVHKKSHKKTNAMVRDAQNSLINLGYMKGPADGLLGPKTKKAIRIFQGEHEMVITGTLTRATYNAIIKADRSRAMAALPMPLNAPVPVIVPPAPAPRDTMAAQPGLVGPTHQDYADPLMAGPTVFAQNGGQQAIRTQELSSRFAKLDVNENINGDVRRYAVTLDGAPILLVDGQPSIIGISETFLLGDEDAIIFSTFHFGDPICAYKHYLLVLAQGRNELRAFGNCTHGYQARKVDDSLFVTFPEVDDERVVGATWRYEEGNLDRI